MKCNFLVFTLQVIVVKFFIISTRPIRGRRSPAELSSAELATVFTSPRACSRLLGTALSAPLKPVVESPSGALEMRQLAAAFLSASLLARFMNRAEFPAKASRGGLAQHTGLVESGSKLPHSKASHGSSRRRGASSAATLSGRPIALIPGQRQTLAALPGRAGEIPANDEIYLSYLFSVIYMHKQANTLYLWKFLWISRITDYVN